MKFSYDFQYKYKVYIRPGISRLDAAGNSPPLEILRRLEI